MDKDKRILTAGFMPALALAILLGFEYASRTGTMAVGAATVGLTSFIAFMLPFAIITAVSRGEEDNGKRFKVFELRFLVFIILMAITLALASFLLNWTTANLFPGEFAARGAEAFRGYTLFEILLVSILLPAVCEELLFRGGVLSVFEKHGFYAAMLVSSISFALVHGSISNLIGPFAVGLVYCYLVYITGSVWAAVLAHVINNSMTVAISFFLARYSEAGLWQYFLIFVLLAFFIFLYFAMGRLDSLVDSGKVPRIKPAGIVATVKAVALAPGLWLLVALFVLKSFYFNS